MHHDQSEIGAPLNVNVEKSQTVLCQPPVHPFLTLRFLSWQKRSEMVTGQFAKHLPSTVNGAPLENTLNLSRSLAHQAVVPKFGIPLGAETKIVGREQAAGGKGVD